MPARAPAPCVSLGDPAHENKTGMEITSESLLGEFRAQHLEILQHVERHYIQQQQLLAQALGAPGSRRSVTFHGPNTVTNDEVVAANVWNYRGDDNFVHKKSSCSQGEMQNDVRLPGSPELEPIIPMPSPKACHSDITPSDLSSRNMSSHKEVSSTLRRKVEQRVAANRKGSSSWTKTRTRHCLTKQAEDRHIQNRAQKYLLPVLNSAWFDLCSFGLIAAFTVYVIMPLTSEQPCKSSRDGHLAIDIVFCVLFALELVFRMAPFGFNIFQSHDWKWNMADAVIVCLTFLQIILEVATSESSIINPMAFRLLRLFRAVSTFRMARVFTMLRELRLLVYAVLGCARSLGFSLLMLWSFIVLCGTFLTVGAQSCLENATPEEADQVSKGFGTLGRSCVTLYMAISGGMDWGENYWILETLGWQYQLAYMIYVSFAIFGLVNVFTGVFVEHAMQASNKDREMQIRNQIDEEEHYLKELQRVFLELDINGSGKLSLEEFTSHLSDERALAYFQAVKLDVSEVGRLFRLMDSDNSGSIDIEEFIIGCQRLKGESRSLDIKVALMELESLQEDFQRFSVQITEQLAQQFPSKSGGPCLL